MAGGDGMTWGVVGLALASVLALLGRRRKSDAELLFAVFCGSVAMAMLRPALGDAPAAVQALVTLGACATCNAYWLVARALFRGDGGVARTHVAAAAGVAALIVAYRAAEAGGIGAGVDVLGDLLTLASSTVLVLAFCEALYGWRDAGAAERRLRAAFMVVYGGCVLVGTVSGALASADAEWAAAHRAVVLGCATAIIVFTHVALRLRRATSSRVIAQAEAPTLPHTSPSADDLFLAEAIRAALEQRALYREPELKVADLAAAIGSAEHKVSRAITQALGERNFNQLVNRYRIAHACHLLRAHPARSVLAISGECGFASLGPFNRAFKAATGLTPSAWRASRQNAPSSPDHLPACPSS